MWHKQVLFNVWQIRIQMISCSVSGPSYFHVQYNHHSQVNQIIDLSGFASLQSWQKRQQPSAQKSFRPGPAGQAHNPPQAKSSLSLPPSTTSTTQYCIPHTSIQPSVFIWRSCNYLFLGIFLATLAAKCSLPLAILSDRCAGLPSTTLPTTTPSSALSQMLIPWPEVVPAKVTVSISDIEPCVTAQHSITVTGFFSNKTKLSAILPAACGDRTQTSTVRYDERLSTQTCTPVLNDKNITLNGTKC